MSLAEARVIEIRDKGTFIPAMVVKLRSNAGDAAYVARRVGITSVSVYLFRLDDGVGTNDPHSWGPNDRTYSTVHHHLMREGEFEKLSDGDVLDVEFLLGEVATPKRSERLEHPDVPV